jgi:hypothetical protein
MLAGMYRSALADCDEGSCEGRDLLSSPRVGRMFPGSSAPYQETR